MIAIQPAYEQLYTDTEKFIILITGGRGSGKSFNGSTFVERLLFEEGHLALFSRYTMAAAGVSVIPEFQEKIELDGTMEFFDINQTEIVNKISGSKILFRGIKTSSGNQTANLKSIPGLTTFIGDEMEEWQSEKDFDTLRLSIRQKGIQNRIILIMNPSDGEHFIYQKYIRDTHKVVQIDAVDIQMSTHPEVLHIHTSYLDNIENLADQFLHEIAVLKEKAIKEATREDGSFDQVIFNKSKYAYKIMGRWADVAEGVIFTDWEEGAFDTSLPYCFGQDYGFSIDPDTLIKVAVDKRLKRVYVDERYYKCAQLGLNDLYEVNKSRLDRPNDLIVGDSSEDRLIADLAKLGLNIEECEKGPGSVSAGITDLLDYRIIVTPNSPNVKRELKSYKWSDKKAGIPVDANNHCFVGTTEIITNRGIKKIIDIKEGDLVDTPNGFKEVLSKWNNGKQRVNKYLMQLDTFCVYLHCTENHLIKTEEGWEEIKDLKNGQKIYLHKSLTEKHINYTQAKGIIQGVQKECTELYGSIQTELYQKDTTFTTKMITRGIMIYQTSNLKKVKPIYKGMVLKKFKTKNGFQNSVKKVLKHLKNGMQAKRVLSNINYKRYNQVLENGICQKKNAGNARVNSNLKTIITNSALMPVNQNSEDSLGLITKIENANNAVMTLKSISIAKSDFAQNHVQDIQEVYDLMVADEHCYFANGVLVHNCIDPLRYAFRKLAGYKITNTSALKAFG